MHFIVLKYLKIFCTLLRFLKQNNEIVHEKEKLDKHNKKNLNHGVSINLKFQNNNVLLLTISINLYNTHKNIIFR